MPVIEPIYLDRLPERLMAMGYAPRPSLEGQGDFRCVDESDGKGTFLAEWFSKDPVPSLAALQAIDPDSYAPIPDSIPLWQFAWEAADRKIISTDDALAWVSAGKLPPTLTEKIKGAGIGPAMAFGLTLRLAGIKTIERSDPLLPDLAALFGMDGPALAAFLRSASQRRADIT